MALFFTMHQVIAQAIALQRVVHWSMMNAMLFFMEFVDMASRVCNMWRHERAMGDMKNQLLGSFYEKMFEQRIRLSYDKFHSLIRVVGPSLKQKIHP